MPTVQISQYRVTVLEGALPADYDHLRSSAKIFEEYAVRTRESGPVSTVMIVSERIPHLVVAQHHAPDGPGFPLGLLIVPETGVVFIGAGERVLAYDLPQSCRLWEDHAQMGFWGFERHGDVIVMSAELELAAWDVRGRKLWTTFVAPPWSYELRGDTVEVEVMGTWRSFNLNAGPPDS